MARLAKAKVAGGLTQLLTKEPTPVKGGGHHHAHGCTVCSLRYTDSCSKPDENARCSACRGGHARPVWDRNGDPRDCCRVNSFTADRVEVERYKLAGPGPWFRCRTCSRTHPYQPRTRTST